MGRYPEGWTEKPLKTLAVIVQGSTPASNDARYWSDEPTPFVWVTPADMNEYGFIETSSRYITQEGYNSCGTQLVPEGSVVISTRAPIGKVNLTSTQLCTNQGCKSLVPRDIEACYLYWAVLNAKEDLVLSGRGTTFMELSSYDLGHIKVPVPPKEEQQAIAALLDEKCTAIDATANTLETQISTLERYRASVIHEAVTRGLDPTAPTKPSNVDWIGDIPQSWEIKKLKHLVVSFESGTSVRAASYPADRDEKGVLSLSAVFGGQYDPSANKRIDDDELVRASCPVRSGSLLVSRCNTSEWVGLPAFVERGNPNLYLPDKLWQIDCGSTLLNKFVWYALHSKKSRDYCAVMSVGSSSSMQNIASFDLLNMHIPVPQSKEDLLAVVTFLDSKLPAIDAVITTKREQLDVLKRRRQSLIYEYVTGKRRVGEEG